MYLNKNEINDPKSANIALSIDQSAFGNITRVDFNAIQ